MNKWNVLNDEPPWIVEIDGVKFAVPEPVVLLLKDVSEERDDLKAKAHAADALYDAVKAYRARGYHDVNKAWEKELDKRLDEYRRERE